MAAHKLKEKDIDFIKIYEKKEQPSPIRGKTILLWALPILLAAIFFSLYFNQRMKLRSYHQELEEINGYIAENQELYDSVLENDSVAALMQRDIDSIGGVKTALETYREITGTDYEAIAAKTGPGLTIIGMNFDLDSMTLKITGKTEQQTLCADYVTRLKDTGLFDAVGYFGYLNDSNDLIFTFEVTCLIKAVMGS